MRKGSEVPTSCPGPHILTLGVPPHLPWAVWNGVGGAAPTVAGPAGHGSKAEVHPLPGSWRATGLCGSHR